MISEAENGNTSSAKFIHRIRVNKKSILFYCIQLENNTFEPCFASPLNFQLLFVKYYLVLLVTLSLLFPPPLGSYFLPAASAANLALASWSPAALPLWILSTCCCMPRFPHSFLGEPTLTLLTSWPQWRQTATV